jgi:hypothetical protein
MARPTGKKIATFMGVSGMTRREAFRAWARRVRRHTAWRLIQPELKAYLVWADERAARDDGHQLIYGFERWISGPARWTENGWWRDERDVPEGETPNNPE